MSQHQRPLRYLIAGLIVSLVACQDSPVATVVPDQFQAAQLPQAAQDAFDIAARNVLALPGTVFADHDETSDRLVFGVENAAAIPGVENALARLGILGSAYSVEVIEPISFASETLRTEYRPTKGGIQIHFGNYLCTLGFNVDHSGGRSFVTNSHCTNNQGTTGTTEYYQPTSSVNSSPIAIEADDPAYFKGGECSRGKKCRYSDASRAQYQIGTFSSGEIAKTTGYNNGSINVAGSFSVVQQEDADVEFSGTVNKVGRTTGWTRGNVSNTCVRVNVSGSNIQLLCQTLVQNSGTQIVGSGDSGSPVFREVSGGAELVGILWGGNSSGDLFVFSPLKNIQDELGNFTAANITSAEGIGTGGGGSEDPGGGECIPKGPNGNNCK